MQVHAVSLFPLIVSFIFTQAWFSDLSSLHLQIHSPPVLATPTVTEDAILWKTLSLSLGRGIRLGDGLLPLEKERQFSELFGSFSFLSCIFVLFFLSLSQFFQVFLLP